LHSNHIEKDGGHQVKRWVYTLEYHLHKVRILSQETEGFLPDHLCKAGTIVDPARTLWYTWHQITTNRWTTIQYDICLWSDR